jgi:hypothetical protein
VPPGVQALYRNNPNFLRLISRMTPQAGRVMLQCVEPFQDSGFRRFDFLEQLRAIALEQGRFVIGLPLRVAQRGIFRVHVACVPPRTLRNCNSRCLSPGSLLPRLLPDLPQLQPGALGAQRHQGLLQACDRPLALIFASAYRIRFTGDDAGVLEQMVRNDFWSPG